MHRHLALIACGLICASQASAANLPPRKAGLWKLKMTFASMHMPPQVMQHCIDAKTDAMMNANFGGMAKESCAKQDMRPTPGGFTMDSVCNFGGATTTSHAVFTGDFNNAYTVDVTSTRQGGRPMPGVAPGGQTHMNIAARWTGPCKAGMRPGDMILPGGMKMNVLDLQRMRGALPQR
jgi:uncharacterized protein (DUF2237 family)